MTDLGTEIERIKARLAAVERSSRLGAASIDDTALEVRDDAGSLRALVGQQGDGTTAVNVVNGPTPAEPTAPLVASVIGGVAAEWDGQLIGGTGVPLDFARVEVHAAASSGFTPTAATLVGTIETAQGAIVVIPTTTPVYVRLLTRTTSGTASAPSTQNGPIAPAMIVADDVADGIITGTKLAADAIDGKVITGATVRTAATGRRIELTPDNVIVIRNDAGDVVVEIDPDGYRLYDADGELIAEIRLTVPGQPGGFWTRNFDFPQNVASFLNGGQLQFQPVIPGIVDVSGSVSYSAAPMSGTPYTMLTLMSGEIDSTLDEGVIINLLAERGSAPKLQMNGDLEIASRIRVGGVDQGKGFKKFTAIQTDSASTTTAEIATITTPSITFETGRAYRITYHGLLLSTVANDIARCRVWRGSIGGAGVSLVDSINTHQIPVANQHVLMDMAQDVINTTGSNISAVLIGTVLRNAGTGNVKIVANASNPAWIEVQDIGLASDYPLARAV
ncbi:hypothetical protein [Streptomyces sp. NPDC015130]|uniref:hypothetical protein n=1 Tax=Streptomyces sp. NPDC015130 TaxID=3364940 RepID=UPI0037003E3B